ncbi:MAG: YdcF family protein [Peptococcaceae bacterium]
MKKIKQCYQGMGKFVLGLFLAWFISFVGIEALIVQAAHSQENEQAEYVIVLGAGLRGQQLSLTLYYRLNKAIEYLNNNPAAEVIVSGGQGAGEDIAEAVAMKDYLMTNGIQEKRIFTESDSTNTFENLLYSKRILTQEKGLSNGIRVMIITSDFHMLRAKLLASRLGLIPYGAPSPSVDYLKPYYYFREYFAVLKSLLLDFERNVSWC